MITWESLEWEEMLHSQEGGYWFSFIGEEICGGHLGHVSSTELKAQKLGLVCHLFSHKCSKDSSSSPLLSVRMRTFMVFGQLGYRGSQQTMSYKWKVNQSDKSQQRCEQVSQTYGEPFSLCLYGLLQIRLK